MELFPGLRRWTASVWRSELTADSSFFLNRRIAVTLMFSLGLCGLLPRHSGGALKEIADPQSETNQSIHDMIALAVEKRILTDDRPRCTREVAKAGNKAIHDPEMCNRNYSPEKVKKT
jgi:hypothetical protein